MKAVPVPMQQRPATRAASAAIARVFIVLCGVTLAGTPDAFGQTAATPPLLTLEEAVSVALEDNYRIQIARNDARIAQNNYSLGNAGFLPTVGLSAQQSQTSMLRFGDYRQDSWYGNPAVDLAAGLNMTLYDGFARSARYRQLEVLSDQGLTNATRVVEETLADVVTRYYDVARQQQQLLVQQEAVGISEERLQIAELRRDLGSASELEVRRARVDLNADRAALLRQEVTLANAKAALAQVLGQEQGADFRVSDDIAVVRNLDLDALQADALQRNRALQVARGNETVAELARREIRSEWFPTINLQAGYVMNDFADRIGVPGTRPGGFSYGVSARFNLFEGFNRDRRMQNAQLDIRNTQLEVQDIRTLVETNLQNAYKQYENSLVLIDLEEENVGLAQANVDVALDQFELGTITSIELREVQTALLDAQSRLVAARFEAKRAEIDLRLLAGRLLDEVQE